MGLKFFIQIFLHIDNIILNRFFVEQKVVLYNIVLFHYVSTNCQNTNKLQCKIKYYTYLYYIR